MSDCDYGYVGRVRECGCVVFVSVDRPAYADSVAEALYDGLTLERLPVDECRKLTFGCEHGRRRPRPGGYLLWRVESVCVVAAPDEGTALEAGREVDDYYLKEHRRAIGVDESTVQNDELIFVWGDDAEPPTLERWINSPVSDAERARMNRKTLEDQGQGELDL